MSQSPAPAPNEQPTSEPSSPPLSAGQNAGVSAAVPSSGGRLRLFVAGALFIGWIAWLSVTALTKPRAPIVSRAQAAAASVPVVAEVTAADADRELMVLRPGGLAGQFKVPLKQPAGKPAVVVAVIEWFKPDGAATLSGEIAVLNLPASTGYAGPGQYLLLLNRDGEAEVETPGGSRPAYTIAGQQRSPGADLDGVGPPMIYRWGEGVRAQVKQMFPAKD
jgi:hypothetical protein